MPNTFGIRLRSLEVSTAKTCAHLQMERDSLVWDNDTKRHVCLGQLLARIVPGSMQVLLTRRGEMREMPFTVSDPSHEALPSDMPRMLGKYEILRPLATGGMAEIFLARAHGIEGFEKAAVVKRLRPEIAADDDCVRMFLDEARLLATLQHSNIVHVYDVGALGGSYFFSMELLHGEDLRAIVKRSWRAGADLPLEHSIFIIMCTLAGLHYAHQKTGPDGRSLHIVHRDVSPSNIFVTFDGDVKLLDFGIAKTATQSSQTRAGVLKGKLRYMSPEQCTGQPVDRRSDVFAAAIVLWELTTGHKLFSGKNDFEILKRIIEMDIPTPSSVRPGYPAELERIVMKGLARHLDDRYPSAQAMQVDLEAFAREERLATSSLALAGLMQKLFADRIEAWALAERSGRSFTDHFMEVLDNAPRPSVGSRDSLPGSGSHGGLPPPSHSQRIEVGAGAPGGGQALAPGLPAQEPATRVAGPARPSSAERAAEDGGLARTPSSHGAPRRSGAPLVAGVGLSLLAMGGVVAWLSMNRAPAPEPPATAPAAATQAPQPAGQQNVEGAGVHAEAPAPETSAAAPAVEPSAARSVEGAGAAGAAFGAPPGSAAPMERTPPAPAATPKPRSGSAASTTSSAAPSAAPTKSTPSWDKDSPFLPP